MFIKNGTNVITEVGSLKPLQLPLNMGIPYNVGFYVGINGISLVFTNVLWFSSLVNDFQF
jgi:hypothetical protein